MCFRITLGVSAFQFKYSFTLHLYTNKLTSVLQRLHPQFDPDLTLTGKLHSMWSPFDDDFKIMSLAIAFSHLTNSTYCMTYLQNLWCDDKIFCCRLGYILDSGLVSSEKSDKFVL